MDSGVRADEAVDAVFDAMAAAGFPTGCAEMAAVLEDGFGNAFAGKYESVFRVNQGSPEERLEAFEEAGIPLLCQAPTNQIFPIFPNALAEEINSRYLTTFQCHPDPEHTCLRFCTSWITNEEAVADFVEHFKDMVIKYQ